MFTLGLWLALSVIACSRSDDPAPAVAQRTCGLDVAPVLGNEGIGAFAIGTSIDSLQTSCVVLGDTTLTHGSEGLPERRVAILLGQDTVEATVVNGAVWRIEVVTPRIRTQDSIGVGSTLATLRGQPMRFLGYGEGGPFVRVTRHCGLSLELTGVPRLARRIEDIPPTASVERVLIVGCKSR